MASKKPVSFIFALPNAKDENAPSSARKTHIRQLNDLLHLSIERGDLERARRAWSILVRCKEFDWKAMWRTGLLLLPSADAGGDSADPERLAYLRRLMRQHAEDCEQILLEIVLCLAEAGRFKDALDELDLYLPSFPYQDNPSLHLYAGLMTLQISTQANNSVLDESRLRDSQAHFERALALDPGNDVATAYLKQVTDRLSKNQASTVQAEHDVPSDAEDGMDVDEDSARLRPKRARRVANS